MEITKLNESTNVDAKVTLGSIDYVFSYSIKESKIVSLSGSASVEGVNKGSFNIYINSSVDNSINFNFNFASVVEVAIRSIVVTNVDSIFTQINK